MLYKTAMDNLNKFDQLPAEEQFRRLIEKGTINNKGEVLMGLNMKEILPPFKPGDWIETPDGSYGEVILCSYSRNQVLVDLLPFANSNYEWMYVRKAEGVIPHLCPVNWIDYKDCKLMEKPCESSSPAPAP